MWVNEVPRRPSLTLFSSSLRPRERSVDRRACVRTRTRERRTEVSFGLASPGPCATSRMRHYRQHDASRSDVTARIRRGIRWTRRKPCSRVRRDAIANCRVFVYTRRAGPRRFPARSKQMLFAKRAIFALSSIHLTKRKREKESASRMVGKGKGRVKRI